MFELISVMHYGDIPLNRLFPLITILHRDRGEVMGSSPENSLLQKCRERLHT
jgi:hypothetical protein